MTTLNCETVADRQLLVQPVLLSHEVPWEDSRPPSEAVPTRATEISTVRHRQVDHEATLDNG